MKASRYLLAQDMNQLDHDHDKLGTPISTNGGFNLERAKAISFVVPAAGLAMGQAGRLAPF
jgi:hypothetical protein